ncbi:GyrI-like domain-containing protein [Mycoplasmatota bacterium]|nr:GyrI-like domain-containing protein [Mycoplasmatota bacterium]
MLIDVESMHFIMVNGIGDPNNNDQFEEAIKLLYGLSYTIKMSYKKNKQPGDYYKYVVAPLEGLWWIDEGEFSFKERSNWKWTLMIRQPSFVHNELFNWAYGEFKKKHPEITLVPRLEEFHEGLCAQFMHIGPYSEEEESVKKLNQFILDEGLTDTLGKGGKHHEIYISDPRRVQPGKLKTVLRHPIERKYGMK